MKYSIEQHLSMLEYWSIYQLMMNELPVAVYWIGQDEQLKYCNNNAQKRLDGKKNLEDVFLNYEHIPIKKAPVSYTHLDVYKRQIQYHLRALPRADTAAAAFTIVDNRQTVFRCV